MPREDLREQRRVADHREAALLFQRDGTGDELAGRDADADRDRAAGAELRRQLLVDGACRADGVDHAAVAWEEAHETVADDLAHFAVLPRDLRFLDLHGTRHFGDDARGIAVTDTDAAEVGDEHRPLLALRLGYALDRHGLALGRLRGHLFVQLFELRLLAQRRDHLRERAAEDPDLVGGLDVGGDVVIAAGDRLRDAGELLDRARDALGDQEREEKREQKRPAAAPEERVLDLAERRELAVEGTDEHRGADGLVPRDERLPRHDVVARLDLDVRRRDRLAGLEDLIGAVHLLHPDARRVAGARQDGRFGRREHDAGVGRVGDAIGERLVDRVRVEQIPEADRVRSDRDRMHRGVIELVLDQHHAGRGGDRCVFQHVADERELPRQLVGVRADRRRLVGADGEFPLRVEQDHQIAAERLLPLVQLIEQADVIGGGRRGGRGAGSGWLRRGVETRLHIGGEGGVAAENLRAERETAEALMLEVAEQLRGTGDRRRS